MMHFDVIYKKYYCLAGQNVFRIWVYLAALLN